MFQVFRTRNKKLMDVQSRFLSTTLQIWCYCGHVIKSRTMRHLNFDCQLNLSKSHKVWSSYLVSFRRSLEKFGWGRKTPPPCEIGLRDKITSKILQYCNLTAMTFNALAPVSLTLLYPGGGKCPSRQTFDSKTESKKERELKHP